MQLSKKENLDLLLSIATKIWIDGPSPSGKASGFGLDIPRFES